MRAFFYHKFSIDPKRILLLLFLSTISISLLGQKVIKGRVLDENLDPFPGVEVYGNDTLKLGTTDIEGYFEVQASREIDKLTFSSISYEITSITNYFSALEVILFADGNYDSPSRCKADKLYNKRIDKLSILHKQAFKAGLFDNGEPCFEYEFASLMPQTDQVENQMKSREKAIKKYFKKLEIGDTIKVPYSGMKNHDGTDRVSLTVYSNTVDDQSFDCVIEGVLLNKDRKNNGYMLLYEVTSLSRCMDDTLVYDGKEIVIGSTISHNMKYFKILN